VVLAYVRAVANEFIYSQWVRKGMNTGGYFSGECSMGPKANVLHSAVRIFFKIVGSHLCLSSTEQFMLFPVRTIT